MPFNDPQSLKAICASIIFSTRFKRELEKASVVGDPGAREDTIILSRDVAIREAVEIAGEIMNQCGAESGK